MIACIHHRAQHTVRLNPHPLVDCNLVRARSDYHNIYFHDYYSSLILDPLKFCTCAQHVISTV